MFENVYNNLMNRKESKLLIYLLTILLLFEKSFLEVLFKYELFIIKLKFNNPFNLFLKLTTNNIFSL